MSFAANPRRERPRRSREAARALLLAAAITSALAACERRSDGPPEPAADRSHARPARVGGDESEVTAAPVAGADRSLRRGVHPLVGFRSEDPARVATSGRVVARWVELEDGLHRAIEIEPGASLAVRVDPEPGATVRAGLAVRGDGGAAAPGRADFRLRLAPASDARGVVLAEASVETGGRGDGSVDAEVPASWQGPGWLVLSSAWTPGPEGSTGAAPRLWWIEPRVEWAVAGAAPSGEGVRPWNVVLVTSDTTRQDDLGCYGGPAATPNLSALAAEGAAFARAYTVACVTTPSHASLLTASHASDHRVYDNSSVLPEERVTIAEALHDRGWATAGLVSGLPLIRALGFSQGFDFFDDALALRTADQPARRLLRERPGDETVDLFLDWLRTRPARPFFAWIHLFDAHQPYAPPAAFLPPGGDPSDDPDLARLFSWPDGSPRRIRPGEVARLPEATRARADAIARARYRGELAFVDAQVGRLVEALRRDGLWDRTIFVFAADHGENFGDRGALAWAHAGLFHDVTHIPLVVRVPGTRAPGARVQALVGNMDVAPTVLDALGVAVPAAWKGRSLLPAIETPSSFEARPSLVIEAPREKEVSVRTPDWMYREMAPGADGDGDDDGDDGEGAAPWRKRFGYLPGESEQLFDLAVDPLERTNVVASRPDAAQRMKGTADAFLASRPSTARAAALGGGAHREALKALGYAD